MSEPTVGKTRMQTNATVRVNPDGSETVTGATRYAQIYLGKKAANELGLSKRGWYVYTAVNADAANRSSRTKTNNPLRAGVKNYADNQGRDNLQGRIDRTAAATSRRRAAIAAGRR